MPTAFLTALPAFARAHASLLAGLAVVLVLALTGHYPAAFAAAAGVLSTGVLPASARTEFEEVLDASPSFSYTFPVSHRVTTLVSSLGGGRYLTAAGFPAVERDANEALAIGTTVFATRIADSPDWIFLAADCKPPGFHLNDVEQLPPR